MDVSPNVLRKETVATLKDADDLLGQIKLERGAQTPAHVVATLLLTKAQCLQTLTLLRETRQ